MAVSKARASSIVSFARYNDAFAGNTPASGAFSLQAGSSATHYVSTDGLTWTANALTNSFGNFNWCLYSTGLRTWIFSSSTPNYVIFSPTASFTAKVRSWQNGSWAIGNTFNGAGQFLDTGVDILWGNGSGIISDMSGMFKWVHPNTGVTMISPAWDGGSTYATLPQASASQGHYSTGDSTSGSGILPWSSGNVGYNGWSNWTTYNLPTTATWNHIKYYNGFWYVTTNSGVVYYTANIATSSPSWTNAGSIINSPFFIANNELWVLPFWGAGTTAFRVTAGGGSFNSVTLPANKQCTGIAYGNGVYIISCSDGTVHRSTTGASGSFSNVSTGAASTTTFSVSPIAFGAA